MKEGNFFNGRNIKHPYYIKSFKGVLMKNEQTLPIFLEQLFIYNSVNDNEIYNCCINYSEQYYKNL